MVEHPRGPVVAVDLPSGYGAHGGALLPPEDLSPSATGSREGALPGMWPAPPAGRLPGWQQELGVLVGLGGLAPAPAPEVLIPAPPPPATREARQRKQAEERMICGMWAQTGSCAYGSRCQFAHDLSPGRAPSNNGSVSPTDEQRAGSPEGSPAGTSPTNSWPTIGEAAAMTLGKKAQAAQQPPPPPPPPPQAAARGTSQHLRSSPLAVGAQTPLHARAYMKPVHCGQHSSTHCLCRHRAGRMHGARHAAVLALSRRLHAAPSVPSPALTRVLPCRPLL